MFRAPCDKWESLTSLGETHRTGAHSVHQQSRRHRLSFRRPCNRPVFDPYNTIREIPHPRIMRNNHNRPPPLVRQITHHLHHVATGVRIKCRSRLIRQDDRWIARQRTGYGHPLLLPSAQVGGKGSTFRAQPNLLQQLFGPLLRCRSRDALEIKHEPHVFSGGQRGEQVESLEHESNVLQANPRQFFLPQTRDFGPGNAHAAGRRRQNAAHDRKQRSLSAARRAHQHQQFTRMCVKINATERERPRTPLHVVFRKNANCNCGLHLSISLSKSPLIRAKREICNSPLAPRTHPLNTIAGSIRVTLLIETSAAPTHMSSVTKNIPTAMLGGIRIAAPPAWLAWTTNPLTIIPSAYPINALIAACFMMTL